MHLCGLNGGRCTLHPAPERQHPIDARAFDVLQQTQVQRVTVLAELGDVASTRIRLPGSLSSTCRPARMDAGLAL